tara:strand:- start:338 stop:601 length:264 start_codon:yes stop_codon:yes gene_type:complete
LPRKQIGDFAGSASGPELRNLPPAVARWFGKESTMPTPSERKDERIHYDADKARGAEIILTRRRNRAIFIAGLVGFVVLALILNWFA